MVQQSSKFGICNLNFFRNPSLAPPMTSLEHKPLPLCNPPSQFQVFLMISRTEILTKSKAKCGSINRDFKSSKATWGQRLKPILLALNIKELAGLALRQDRHYDTRLPSTDNCFFRAESLLPAASLTT